MAEELNPAEEAENTVPTNEGTENTEATASESVEEVSASVEEEVSAPVEEEVSAEEPLELYSTADDAAFMNENGEFSWEAYESAGGYTESERDRYDSLYENTLSTIAEKTVIEGTVVSVGKKEVVINIGYKSEGVVAVTEFRYNPDLKAGDRVPVYVEFMFKFTIVFI